VQESREVMPTKIKVDGTSEWFVMPDKPTLEFLQGLVGGYIEDLRFSDGSCLMVHEEGKLIGLPLNPGATALSIVKGRPDTIVGDAVFFSRDEYKKMLTEERDDDLFIDDDPLDPYTHDRAGDSASDEDGS